MASHSIPSYLFALSFVMLALGTLYWLVVGMMSR